MENPFLIVKNIPKFELKLQTCTTFTDPPKTRTVLQLSLKLNLGWNQNDRGKITGPANVNQDCAKNRKEENKMCKILFEDDTAVFLSSKDLGAEIIKDPFK